MVTFNPKQVWRAVLQTAVVFAIVAPASVGGYLLLPPEWSVFGLFAGWGVGGYLYGLGYDRVDGFGFNYGEVAVS